MIETDAAVIGGGFFGCHIALALKSHGFERVHLIEREQGLMRRASFANQARVHNGYHYPRSLTTALSSHHNFGRFVREYAFAIVPGIDMIYAIATTSRISANQFARFCDEIGAPCREHRSSLCRGAPKQRPGGSEKNQHVRNYDRRRIDQHAVEHPERRTEHLDAAKQRRTKAKVRADKDGCRAPSQIFDA